MVKLGATPVVPATSPHRSLADVLQAARNAPGKVNYAAGGGGGGATTTNLTAEFLQSETKVDLQAIPYKGSGPALVALLAGEVDLGFDIPTSALAHIKAGKLHALAVTSQRRSTVLPEVPTVAESGLPGFEVTGWFGLLAPAATPAAVLARLNKDVNEALNLPDVKERLASLGLELGGGTAADFARLIDADTQRYGAAIRRMGIKLE